MNADRATMVGSLWLFVCLLLLPAPTAGFSTTPDHVDPQYGGLRRRSDVVRRALDDASDGADVTDPPLAMDQTPREEDTALADEGEDVREGISSHHEHEMGIPEEPESNAQAGSTRSSTGSEGGGCPDARNSTMSNHGGEAKEDSPQNSDGGRHSDHGKEAKETDSAPTTNTTAGHSNAGNKQNEAATVESSRHDDHDGNHDDHHHDHHHHHHHSEAPDLPTAPAKVIRGVCRQCRKCRRVYEKYMEGYQFCQVCVEICPNQYRGALTRDGNARFRRLSGSSHEEAAKPAVAGSGDEEKKDEGTEATMEIPSRSDSSGSEGVGCPGYEESGDEGVNPDHNEDANHNDHNGDHGMGMTGDGDAKTSAEADTAPNPPTKADKTVHVVESAPDGNSIYTSTESSDSGMNGAHASFESVEDHDHEEELDRLEEELDHHEDEHEHDDEHAHHQDEHEHHENGHDHHQDGHDHHQDGHDHDHHEGGHDHDHHEGGHDHEHHQDKHDHHEDEHRHPEDEHDEHDEHDHHEEDQHEDEHGHDEKENGNHGDEHAHHDEHDHHEGEHAHHGDEHNHHEDKHGHHDEEHEEEDAADDHDHHHDHSEPPELPMAKPRVIRMVCRQCRKCRRIYEKYSQGYKFCQVCVEICPGQYRGSLPIQRL